MSVVHSPSGGAGAGHPGAALDASASASASASGGRLAIRVAGAAGALAFVVYCVFSVTRHLRFGSGSWDMGCYVHNLYILAFGKPPVSSVLGDVHFWGGVNHFMPSLYLAAPLAWTGSTSSLLVLQALLVSSAVVPLALLGVRRGLGPVAVAGVSLAYLFAAGTQTMVNFDVHEIAPVPLCLFIALWGFEVGRRAVAWPALLVLAGTKESAIVYAAAVGAYVAVTMRERRLEGAAVCVFFLAWFFVVTAVIQPALLDGGEQRMIHVARYAHLGDSPAAVARQIVLHPLDTLGLMVSHPLKRETLAITAGGFAFLTLLAPETLLLAAPNLAERFLSDKREMWGLGFHYSLVLVAVCALGSVVALGRLRAALSSSQPRLVRPLDVWSGLSLVGATAVSLALAPHPPEFATLHKPYMAGPEAVARYRRALAVIPEYAPVVAQNHFLPHLAFRQFIWQPEQRFVARADFVILDAHASPWPHASAHVRGLVARLRADPTFRVAFEEETTVVFERVERPPAGDIIGLTPSLTGAAPDLASLHARWRVPVGAAWPFV